MPNKIQVRRDTSANWASSNPTLSQGEFGYETDTTKFKIGTGSTAWNSLSYPPANPTFTGVVTVPAGSVSAPSITPTGDTNTGIYFPDADTVAIAEGGAEALRVNSSGNVLINKTTDDGIGKLQVEGNITTTGTILSTSTYSATTGVANIYLNSATGNRIDFAGAGVGVSAPSLTTRSAGTKIVLYPSISAILVDFAQGIENNYLWTSVPSSTEGFKWYAGTTNIATLAGSGNLNITGNFTIDDTQVLTNRKTGWAAATGTATRTTFDTSTVTTAQLAERVKALIDDLTSHGIIGA